MVFYYEHIGTETTVKVGPFPLDDLSQPESRDSRSGIKYADKSPDYNDTLENINPESISGELSGEKLISNTLEESIIERGIELYSINDLANKKGAERLNKLITVLIRNETIDFLNILTERQNANNIFNLIQKSNNYLHTFADLVSEDLISLEDNKFILTDLGRKLIKNITEGRYD